MIRLAVIGGGRHSRENHLPALARYASLHPGEVELAAFCDLKPQLAAAIACEYGFAQCYTDMAEMLATESLDGCIAITPRDVTAAVAKKILCAGVSLLLEKPPGSSPQEAAEICELVRRTAVPAMVSVNRRFDPAICKAGSWRAERPLATVKATMLRHARTENGFLAETAIHALDTLRWMAGDIADYSTEAWQVDGVWWYRIHLDFESGTKGLLEIMPNCGHQQERYELFGPGYHLIASVGVLDAGQVVIAENGAVILDEQPAYGMPDCVKNGTYAETVEFMDALRENRMPRPSPDEVWPSVDLCHRIQQEIAG